jgi:hypothetical protein
MKRNNLLLALLLLLLSASCYLVHYLLFHDAHHIFIYLVGDIGFVFIEVLLVTLIIHRVLDEREKKQRLQKLNMVIGAFFSELGTGLIRRLVACDSERGELCRQMMVGNKRGEQFFTDTVKWLVKHPFRIDSIKVEWLELKMFLLERRDFILRLLENPNLLEHESFPELLQATFHLIEELEARSSTFDKLPESDLDHLIGDMNRVYRLLTLQWMHYMRHLKTDYPYLFSLALRLNPFDESASPVVRD